MALDEDGVGSLLVVEVSVLLAALGSTVLVTFGGGGGKGKGAKLTSFLLVGVSAFLLGVSFFVGVFFGFFDEGVTDGEALVLRPIASFVSFGGSVIGDSWVVADL